MRKLLARGLETPGQKFDPCLGDAEIRKVVQRLNGGDWAFVDETMNRRDDAWLIGEMLTADESEVGLETFEAWADHSPSARSLAFLGRAQTRAAWEIRGRTYAEHVDPNSWGGFFDGLQLAEATLMAAVDLDPSSSEPWVGLMTTARGLQLGREELRERFDNAHAREPFRPDACDTMLQGLCQKWGGSHDEMFAFARWIEADAEPDSAARDQIHLAHFEFVLANRDEGMLPSTYFKEPEVAAELVAASERFLVASPKRAAARHLRPLNMMVLTIEPTDKRSASIVTEAVNRIAARPTPTPWRYFNDGIGPRYARLRNERLSRAAKF